MSNEIEKRDRPIPVKVRRAQERSSCTYTAANPDEESMNAILFALMSLPADPVNPYAGVDPSAHNGGPKSNG